MDPVSQRAALVLAQGGEGAVDAGKHIGRNGPSRVLAPASADVGTGVEERERGAVGGVVEPAEQVQSGLRAAVTVEGRSEQPTHRIPARPALTAPFASDTVRAAPAVVF